MNTKNLIMLSLLGVLVACNLSPEQKEEVNKAIEKIGPKTKNSFTKKLVNLLEENSKYELSNEPNPASAQLQINPANLKNILEYPTIFNYKNTDGSNGWVATSVPQFNKNKQDYPELLQDGIDQIHYNFSVPQENGALTRFSLFYLSSELDLLSKLSVADRMALPKKPLAIILPSLGDSSEYVFFVKKFVKKGFVVIKVPPSEMAVTPDRTVNLIDAYFIREAQHVSLILNGLAAQNDIPLNTENASIMGISLGGIRLGYLLPVEPRLKNAAFLIAGGNVPYILSYGKEVNIVNYQRQRRADFWREPGLAILNQKFPKFPKANFYFYLNSLLTLDPLIGAQSNHPQRVLFATAGQDEMVPFSTQIELMKAYHANPAKQIAWQNYPQEGHYSSLIHLSEIAEQTANFFLLGLVGTP